MNEPFGGVFRDRRVFVTGHTGFKGAWLTQWLLHLGARVTGYSLAAPTEPSLFNQLALAERLERHHEADINDYNSLSATLHASQAEFVFHLAAQPLVRESYRQPLATYATNVMGTANLMECLRRIEHPCGVVVVTTDKCYENREWVHGYRETDSLGGRDPYSASKAAAEILVASYRASFFGGHPARIATARAGNVIGGGDWATDRLLPDCIRALLVGRPIVIRNSRSVRPWQHVLEPLSGYLWLAACLLDRGLGEVADELVSAFNFGPDYRSSRTVGEVVDEVLKHWPGYRETCVDERAVHEAKLLRLQIDKAHALLDWAPVWDFATGVRETVRWYREASKNSSSTVVALTDTQIEQYCAAAAEKGLRWAK